MRSRSLFSQSNSPSVHRRIPTEHRGRRARIQLGALNGRFIHIKKVRETVRTNIWLQLRYTPNSGHIAPLRRASDCKKTVTRVVLVMGIFPSIRVPEPGLEVMVNLPPIK